MTKNEDLLVTLKECAEVQQAISNALRFGMDQHNPLTLEVQNEANIMIEYYQLVAVMEMLIESGVLHQLSEQDISTIKRVRKITLSDF